MALGEVVHRTDVSWCVFARDIVTDQSHSSLKEHVVTAGVGGGGVSYTVVILMQVPWVLYAFFSRSKRDKYHLG